MLSRKVIIGLTTAVVIVVILGSLLIHSQLQTKTRNDQNTQQQTIPPQVLRAVLSVNGYMYEGYWTRDTTTDSPNFVSTVKYSVSNIGNTNAVNISITIHIDGKLYSSNVIPLLAVSEIHYSSFSVSTVYDSSSNMFIQASCQDSMDSYTLSVGSKLPRWTDESSILKLYITPKEANVVSIKSSILKNKFPLVPNWIALRDWVGNSITYKYDSNVHGVDEYWQLPKETIELRTGDCEDHAILLCSLLRADGWSPNDVYVVIGKDGNGEGHAWVKINLGILGWQYLEPQANGWNTLILDFFITSGYKAEYEFNDSQFHYV
jgi:transglutaminase-like putative cysteine protease